MGTFSLKIKDFEQKTPVTCLHGRRKEKMLFFYNELKMNEI